MLKYPRSAVLEGTTDCWAEQALMTLVASYGTCVIHFSLRNIRGVYV